MTPTETDALITKHLDGWLDAPANSPTLRERIAAMIAEAEAGRDKLWRDGNATLKHERDQFEAAYTTGLALVASLTTARDEAIAAAHLAVEESTALRAQLEKFKWADQ